MKKKKISQIEINRYVCVCNLACTHVIALIPFVSREKEGEAFANRSAHYLNVHVGVWNHGNIG